MLQELVEPLIEAHEDNEDPQVPQDQEAIQATTAPPDPQGHLDCTAKEAPLDCEEIPDLRDLQDLPGQQAQLAPTHQEPTGLLGCDTKRNSRHRNFLPSTEPKTLTALGLKRATLISTTDSNQLPSKT